MTSTLQFGILLALALGSGAGEQGLFSGTRAGVRVLFDAGAGVSVPCPASPAQHPLSPVMWLTSDFTPLSSVSQRWRVLENGTLVIPAEARPHPSPRYSTLVVRCRMSTPRGNILSPPVTLVPDWSTEPARIQTTGLHAAGIAALHCIPSASQPPSALPIPDTKTRWWRNNVPLDLSSPSPNAQYIGAGRWNEWLLVDSVSVADQFSCQLDGTARSAPTTVQFTEGIPNELPRLALSGSEIELPIGAEFCLPCDATDHQTPHYTIRWYHESGGSGQTTAAGAWTWHGGQALCFQRATSLAAGAWICRATTARGDATSRLVLTLQRQLGVSLTPEHTVARGGTTVRLECVVGDPGTTVSWFHMGAPFSPSADVTVLAGGTSLLIRAAPQTQGIWQCEARRGSEVEIATAELRLAEAAPELRDAFIEQTLRPGARVSLRCAATAAPLPHFTWIRDHQQLESAHTSHRYSIGEEVLSEGETVATLNISSAAPEDGGWYTCRAYNHLGHAEHSARLNIYGPPLVRTIPPQRVLAGENFTFICPYAGYPISSVWWHRGTTHEALPSEGRMRGRGAVLEISPTLREDAGRYACTATAPGGATATRELEILVLTPPKISPFVFSTDLVAGSAVRVLCSVSSGDRPFAFAWLKDGTAIPSHLQIQETSMEDFSLLKFNELTEQHEGNYTCRVTNRAASVDYTAALRVKVPPTWVQEPTNTAVAVGAVLRVHCSARGQPTPSATWHRREPCCPNPSACNTGVPCEWRALTTNGTLWAPAATRALAGLYRCTADNSVGPPLLKHINVTVYEPAVLESPTETLNMTCVGGSPTSCQMICSARGDGPLAITWTRHGLDLQSDRVSITEERGAGGSLRSELTLRSVSASDAGQYRCRAHNAHGHMDRTILLHVEEPPSAPVGLRLWGRSARAVKLAWHGFFFPHTALLTTLRSTQPPELRDLHLTSAADNGCEKGWICGTLEGLRPGAAYSVRVRASSRAGPSPLSAPLLFTTLDDAPSEPPQDLRVNGDDDSADLQISWTPPDRDSWNGELLGYVVVWHEISKKNPRDEGRAVKRAGTAIVLRDLQPRTQYTITVRAFNRAGVGPPTSPALAFTADGEPEAPRDVRCSTTVPGEMLVQWTPDTEHRQYELLYAPTFPSRSWWTYEEESQTSGERLTAPGAAGSARVAGVQAAGYMVWLRARGGPNAPPISCSVAAPAAASTVVEIRAYALSPTAVRVSWLAPADRPAPTHYTLHARDMMQMESERVQRVDIATAGDASDTGSDEVTRVVTGLRPGARLHAWIRAHYPAGASSPSQPVLVTATAAGVQEAARIWSFPRAVVAAVGARVRLRCAADGAPPLRRRWSPLPPTHALSAAGDLDILGLQPQWAGNYTCWVRNTVGGGSVTHTVRTRPAPEPPPAPAQPRLRRATHRQLQLHWDRPPLIFPPILGYTIEWSREMGSRLEEGIAGVESEAAGGVLRWLACGERYRVILRAHNVLGPSQPSRELHTSTAGYDPVAPSADEFVWANSSALRLSLLTWDAPCPPIGWKIALRPAPPSGPAGVWTELLTPTLADYVVEVGNLKPGSWYEIRASAFLARSGVISAVYRVPTLTEHGERVGDSERLLGEARSADEEILLFSAVPALLAVILAALSTSLVLLVRRKLSRRAGGTGCGRGLTMRPPEEPPPVPTLEYIEASKYQLSGVRMWSGAGGGAALASGCDSASESSGECAACRRSAPSPPAPAPPLPAPNRPASYGKRVSSEKCAPQPPPPSPSQYHFPHNLIT